MSDHQVGPLVSTVVSTLVSVLALLFAVTIKMMLEMIVNLISCSQPSIQFGFRRASAQGVSDHEFMNLSPIIPAIHSFFEAVISDFATMSN